MNRIKLIAIIEAIAILILISLLSWQINNENNISLDKNEHYSGLLSPRIYSGLLKPQSYLTFNLKPLQNDIQSYIDENKINVSVYVVNLKDGASFGIDEDEEFDPASLNKLPIAIIILRDIETGEFSMDTKIRIKPSYLDDRSGDLYKRNISEISVRELLYYMLAESDDTATKALLDQVSFDEFEGLTNYLNYYNPSLNDTPPSSTHNVFIVTPKSTYNLFTSLYLSTILTPEHSEYILSTLTNTSFDIKKFANLPENVTVSQKYGEYYANGKEMFHSCGIIYFSGEKFFYCIMTRDLDVDRAHTTTGQILNEIYNYVVESKKDVVNYNI